MQALKGVNFDVYRGQVTALFGENGAGKSTLMKILSGVYTPTSGEILLDGQPVTFGSSTEARDRGISIIHQELSLAPNLSVRDNIFMGREIRTPYGVDFAEEERQARALHRRTRGRHRSAHPGRGSAPGPAADRRDRARAVGERRILIMDEPTSALSATGSRGAVQGHPRSRSRGVSIVYISHHLEEALQITDYAVVLRDGAITADGRRAATSISSGSSATWSARTSTSARRRPATPSATWR